MKTTKILLSILLFLIITHPGMSQHHHYYNIGDTIRGRDSIYHYQWWSEDWLSDTSRALCVQWFLNNKYMYDVESFSYRFHAPFHFLHGEILRYCYTDEPINIVGLAAAAYVKSTFYMEVEEASDRQEYLRLYDAMESRFSLKAEVPFVYNSPVRYIDLDVREVPHIGTALFCCNDIKPQRHNIKRIYEYYFDKPVRVEDSFYVGHTQLGANQGYYDSEAPLDQKYFGVYNIGYDTLLEINSDHPCGNMNCEQVPEQLYRYRFINDLNWPMDTSIILQGFHDTLWHWQGINQFLLVFPIIEIDTTWRDGPHGFECPEVTDLRSFEPDDAGVVLLWNTRDEQQQWQISYGLAGTPPDSGIISTSYTPVCQLMNLDSCTDYDVYVRAVCHHDSTEYSLWTGPVTVRICDTVQDSTQTIGLMRPTALEQYTLLMPNPAHNKVQVTSSYTIESVQFFTLDGREMASSHVGDRYATIDIKGWSSGMYIAVIHTSAGMVSRRLIVK